MPRRSFVYWNKAEEDTLPKKSGRDYMVADVLNDEANIIICKFYREGDTARLHYRKDKEPTAVKAEDRLIKAIFGGMIKEVTIKKTGFYQEYYADSDSENADCYDDLLYVGGGEPKSGDSNYTLYWAELPCAPEGTEHPYDAEDETERRAAEWREDMKREYHASLNAFCESGDRYADFYRKSNPEMRPITIGRGVLYEDADIDLKEAIVVSSMLAHICLRAQNEIAEEDIREAGRNREKANEVLNRLGEIATDEMSITGYSHQWHKLPRKIYWLACRTILDTEANYDFQRMMRLVRRTNVFDKWIERQNGILPENVLRGMITISVMSAMRRLKRLVKLESLEAPSIILENEFRMLVEAVNAFTAKIKELITEGKAVEMFGDNKAFFCGKYDFGSCYGFTPTGECCEYDPPVTSGIVYATDEDGNPMLPDIGADAEGNEVRFDTRHYDWDPGEDDFFEIVGEGDETSHGKAYKIKSYRVQTS